MSECHLDFVHCVTVIMSKSRGWPDAAHGDNGGYIL